MVTTNKQINKIIRQIKDKEYVEDHDHIGVRIVDQDYDDYDAKIGDRLGDSHRWDDNNYTDDMCDGTCAISLSAILPDVDYMGYSGDRILVIGGDYAQSGEDSGEIVIRDARVLDVIEPRLIAA